MGPVVNSLELPPGTRKSLPMLLHTACGTLYEEPCLQVIRVEVRGGKWEGREGREGSCFFLGSVAGEVRGGVGWVGL